MISKITIFFGNVLMFTLSFIAGYIFIHNKIPLEYSRNLPSQELNILLSVAILLGIFVSIPSLIDLIYDLCQKHIVLTIIFCTISFLLSIFSIIFFIEKIYFTYIFAALLGVGVNLFGMSSVLRSKTKFPSSNQWTFGHVFGVGIIPFITGLFLIYAELFPDPNYDAITFSNEFLIPLLPLFLLLTIIIYLSFHKWIEKDSEILKILDVNLKEKTTTNNGKEIMGRTCILYYAIPVILYPITIFLILKTNKYDGPFLLFLFLSYLFVVIGLFYFPQKKLNNLVSSLSIRVSSIFLILFGLTFEFIFEGYSLDLPIISEINPILYSLFIPFVWFCVNKKEQNTRYYSIKTYFILFSLCVLLSIILYNRFISNTPSQQFDSIALCSLVIIIIFVTFKKNKDN